MLDSGISKERSPWLTYLSILDFKSLRRSWWTFFYNTRRSPMQGFVLFTTTVKLPSFH